LLAKDLNQCGMPCQQSEKSQSYKSLILLIVAIKSSINSYTSHYSFYYSFYY